MIKRLITATASLLAAAIVLSGKVSAQQKTFNVSGTVTGMRDGEPLVGATVNVTGTQVFVVTDLDGHSSIDVPVGTKTPKLNFSYLGYEANEKTVTKAQVLPDPDAPVLLSLGDNEVEYAVCPSRAGLVWQKASVEKVDPDFSVSQYGSRRLTVHFPTAASGQVEEYFLSVDYTGDVAMAFLENGLVGDHFWYGKPWVIGLNRFNARMQDEDLGFYFRPLSPSVPYMVEELDTRQFTCSLP